MLLIRTQTQMPHRQAGVVMFIALISLVSLTLAGLALFRTVDTGVQVGGNMAMKNSALRSGDAGVQRAANWLYSTNATTPNTLTVNGTGYSSIGLTDDQISCATASWTACWDTLSNLYGATSLGTDSSGNTVQYVIQRLCDISNRCAQSPQMIDDTNQDANQRLLGSGATYYRITVRIDGPRNTMSLIQAMVAP